MHKFFLLLGLAASADAADLLEDLLLAKYPPSYWREQKRLLNISNLPDSATAMTQHGPVTGFRRTDFGWSGKELPQAVDNWYGVRFAPKPERFRPPVELPKKFKQSKTARTIMPSCIQPDLSGKKTMGGEDCLFVDIEAPAGKKNLPVMLWIYGGGYNHGSSWEEGFYMGNALVAQRNFVLAKINYRLGALGFWASDYLKKTSDQKTTGNQGLNDQQAGLKWVYENIEAFGGDPSKITIVGESAGAFSVNWHLASEISQQYFHQAISMAGTNKNTLFYQPYDWATKFYYDYGQVLGCGTKKYGTGKKLIDCLNKIDASKFVMAVQDNHDYLNAGQPKPTPETVPQFASPLSPRMPFGPVIDGSKYGLLADPYDVLMTGDTAKVKFIVGSNRDGGSIFVPAVKMLAPGVGFPITAKTLPIALDWVFQNDNATQKILETYSAKDFANTGFLNWRSNSARRYFENWEDKVVENVWTYVFDEKVGWAAAVTHAGTYHASELQYLFESWYWLPELTVGFIPEGKLQASNAIQCYWANFIHNGDPSENIDSCKDYGLPAWPEFKKKNGKYMHIDRSPYVDQVPGAKTEKFPDDFLPGDDRCDLFDEYGAVWHPLYGHGEEKQKKTGSWLQNMNAR
eukprot:gene1170-218_t